MKKPKIAIYDLTDCEGCEVKIVSLKERLVSILGKIDIANWRLGQEKLEQGPYDITFIEGAPISQHEIDLVKDLRKNSKIIIALGSCAAIGGIPAIMPKEDRAGWYKKIYGEKYKPKGIDAAPLGAYIKVDFAIHGCPIDEDEVVRIFEEILSGKKPTYRGYSVCFECKQAENPCRIIGGKPCLGPITQGGCKAVCVSGGSPCYGCFGQREEANVPALRKILESITDKKEVERYFSMFKKREEEN